MAKPNHLINEKSPYLILHVYNPVDWYPWGEEALEKAKNENKPIFLSIGYSTCHWCHVMEHESFEDEEVADLLNRNFISIKVDREERPDIDSIYMTICHMISGRGGWPLSIFMTPEQKPFFAGTYFPKQSRFGMTGFVDLLEQIIDLWKNEEDNILQTAERIAKGLNENLQYSPSSYDAEELIVRAFDQLDNQFDSRFGGFGSAPKFPSTHRLLFLLRYWKRSGDKLALELVEKTLQEMSKGGIWDHVGFGFHRYSTDKEWLVPHFEKMLYDQAMLILTYTEAYQATKKEEYKEVVDKIITYVIRDMTSPEGGFYSAEDADSEGEEGKFYVWSMKEISKILDDREVEIATRFYNIKKEGNYLDETTKKQIGMNILHTKTSIREFSEKHPEEENLLEKIEKIRSKLFNVRKKRIHPLKDDKILTDWNGLMIVALAKAARIFKNNEYEQAAKNAVDFVLTHLRDKNGRLLHRYREEEVIGKGNINDYSFMIWGLLELYETSFDLEYLEEALKLNEISIKYFWDDSIGGFFFTPNDGEELLVREKQVYDGAIPSGNSVAMMNLLKIGRITSNQEFEEKAEAIMKIFAKQVQRIPDAYTFLLSALDFAIGPSFEVVIVVNEEDDETQEILNSLREEYIPNKVVIYKSEANEKKLVKLLAFLKDYKSINNKTTSYVCQQMVCKKPTNDIHTMLKQLRERN
jgi:uncharacterized protein YyaL (SSP411 family)